MGVEEGAARQEVKKRKTSEQVDGCSEERYAEGWIYCDELQIKQPKEKKYVIL